MLSGIYTPSGQTINNDGGSILTPGTVSNTRVVQADIGNATVAADVPHSDSSVVSYSGGTLNKIDGQTILGANKLTINGLSNLAFRNSGLKPAKRSKSYNYGKKVRITAIDYMSGVVTYASGSFVDYPYIGTDVEAASATAPYTVPAKFVYLKSVSPETVTYSVANA